MSDISLSRRSFVAASAVAAAGIGGLTIAPQAKAEGVITAACAYQSTNYSPVGCSQALMIGATWHVFEGLYELDPHDYTTYKALAADAPVKVSDTEFEVTLRDGAKFSDGTDVTSADVVNAFELNMANGTYGAFLSFIESVVAKDDKTVTINLLYPFESLLEGRLALVKVFPASMSEEELGQTPIGSGPWMYTSIKGEDGGQIDFEPNPYYNGPYPATASSMQWMVQLDGTSRSTLLMDGSVAVMESVPDANAEPLASFGLNVEYVDGFGLPFLMFNTKKAPFDNKLVRQAFFYAIDVEKLIANVMAGHAKACKSFLPEHFPNFHEAKNVYTYDPEKAKSLLAEAGYADGIDVELYTNANWVKDLSAQIKNDLDSVGINTTLRVESIQWAELAPSDDILPYDVMLSPGDPTCFGADPDLLMTWWYGDNVWTAGRSCWNYTPEWAHLQELLQIGRETSGDEQQNAWNECFDILSEEVPLYPLFHRSIATAYDPEAIENFKPIATTGLIFIGADAK